MSGKPESAGTPQAPDEEENRPSRCLQTIVREQNFSGRTPRTWPSGSRPRFGFRRTGRRSSGKAWPSYAAKNVTTMPERRLRLEAPRRHGATFRRAPKKGFGTRLKSPMNPRPRTVNIRHAKGRKPAFA